RCLPSDLARCVPTGAPSQNLVASACFAHCLAPPGARDNARAMSEENIEIVREGYERFAATGEPAADLATDDFVWDMSNFHDWPERQVYEGVDGVRAFLTAWLEAWEGWQLELESLHDAGDRVVALVRQSGTSKAAGMPVEMSFAQVWTLRDGKQSRMEMYSDQDEALRAAGL